MEEYIPFNKPFIIGQELKFIKEAVDSGKISGNGKFTKLCHDFFKKRYGIKECLLTNSCTDALEMSAILIDIKEGDEVIMPSYTFVSTANAFALRGAKIVFADTLPDYPNIDHTLLEGLITSRTKAIVVVHYGGVSCYMPSIIDLARKYNLYIIEDAAHAFDSYFIDNGNRIPLGTIGNLGTYSFHETKNIIAGEGGLLIINDKKFAARAEIIWEKGTNRAAFFRGEVDKYTWVDIGSSFLPSELTAAFLYAQLLHANEIQKKRINLWNFYYKHLEDLQIKGYIKLPSIPSYATVNGHLFFILCENGSIRDKLMNYLKSNNIYAIFHYLPLHLSPYYKDKHDGRELPNTIKFSECLLRLPLFYELSFQQVERIVSKIKEFFIK